MTSNKPSRKRYLILLAFVIIAAMVSFLVYKEGTLPSNKNDKTTKIFVVNRGDGITTIARNLNKEGLIRNRVVFYLVVKEEGIEKNIQAGDFRLSPSMNAYEIAKALTHGTVDQWLQIIEGMRKEEVAQLVSQDFQIPETDFNTQAKEGFLFPDSYLVPREATTGAILAIINRNFQNKFDQARQAKARQMGLTENQVVTLASLVEREGRSAPVKQQIASILLKRLNEGMALDIDATIQYILGYQPDEKTWWKKDLTAADFKIDSPYNTYQNPGLPPGPICNPGLASIDAVLNADPSTPYLFYLTDSEGRIHYARTLKEHENNISRYLK